MPSHCNCGGQFSRTPFRGAAIIQPVVHSDAVMVSLFPELRRRHVIRVAIAYIVTDWVVAQVADLLLDGFAAPEWVVKVILVLLIIGFPMAVVLAWAFQLTPEGIKVELSAEESGSQLRCAAPIEANTATEIAMPTKPDKASITVLPFADLSAE